MERAQAHREAAVHASQSGEARTAARTRALAMEQLSQLRLSRTRTGGDQSVPKRGDEGSGCSVARVSRTHSRHPPLHQAGGPSFCAVCGGWGFSNPKGQGDFRADFHPPRRIAHPHGQPESFGLKGGWPRLSAWRTGKGTASVVTMSAQSAGRKRSSPPFFVQPVSTIPPRHSRK
jgi:hypothetical protein